MADEDDSATLRDGINRELDEQIAATLVELFPPDQDDERRYEAARHLLWQAMVAMISRGVRDQAAVQTIVAALMGILVEGLGADGAAAHLRRMANEIEAGPPGQRQ